MSNVSELEMVAVDGGVAPAVALGVILALDFAGVAIGVGCAIWC
jgi:hypothetical protein